MYTSIINSVLISPYVTCVYFKKSWLSIAPNKLKSKDRKIDSQKERQKERKEWNGTEERKSNERNNEWQI